jgi:hypothetical protein
MWSFLSGIGLKLLMGVAIAGAVLAVLLGARQSGRNAEKVEQLQRAMEGARERRKVETEVSGLGDDELDDKLRHPKRRRVR